ncbi:MAG: 1-deoxy-D-xylulose-5-phosphate reductoisomerase, partial [Oscillospiraceae bacterium]
VKVLSGINGLIEIASENKSDIILNAVVGMVGLLPTLAAIENKKDIALANKETLVAGGELVVNAVKNNNVNIYPVDSEHSAIFQCLQTKQFNNCCKFNKFEIDSNINKELLNKIILTASGGPFFGKKALELKSVKVKDALNHPNWSMGSKITIDSATLMNKGLEIIEAVWLFGINQKNIDVVIHRESIIHSAVEFKDNSIIAQMGLPDMKIPIQYALTYPSREECQVEKLDLFKQGNLSFFQPDFETFKCLNACKKAIEIGGTMPAFINYVNELAVELFLNNKLEFLAIGELVEKATQIHKPIFNYSLNDIDEIIMEAKEFVLKYKN